jgi:MFS family permease
MLGSRLTTIAYPMLILSLTGSPAVAGFAVFAATAPSILAYIPAGALVDRWDPRRTMLLSESGRGIAIATIVGLLVFHWPSVPLIISMAVIEEILEIFATLAERRCVRALVEPDHASSALVRMETRTHVVVLAGRPLGGLLFELEHIFPFAADFLSFFVSVGTLLGIKRPQAAQATRVPTSQPVKELLSGLRWLRDARFARIAMLLAAGMTLVSQALIMVFLAEAHARQLSSAVIGVVLAASGLGGAFGAVAGSRWHFLARQPRIKIQTCIWSAAFLTLALSASSWQIPCMAAVMIVLGFTGAMGNIELDTHLIRRVPPDRLARVTSIGRLMTLSASAIGPALGGILGTWGLPFAVFSLFVITLLFAAVSFRVPSPDLPEEAGACAEAPERARSPAFSAVGRRPGADGHGYQTAEVSGLREAQAVRG